MTPNLNRMLKPGLQIISESWDLYKKNWRQYMPYIQAIFIPTLILSIFGTLSAYLEVYFPESSLISNIIILLVLAAGIVLTLWAGIALVKGVAATLAGQTVAWKDDFKTSNHLIWPAFYTSLLSSLLVFLGGLLLIIPGIIFAIWYSFSYYAVILDNVRGMKALQASKAVVKGQWWSILWRLVVIGVTFLLLSIGVSIVLMILVSLLPLAEFLKSALASLLTSLAGAALTPFSIAASLILYYNAKQNPAPTAPTTTPPQV